METQLSTLQEFNTLAGIMSVAKVVAESQMFGCKTPQQAATLIMFAQSEGKHPFEVLREHHIIEGKMSKRADSMLADFQVKAGGGVIWHVRSDEMVGATFFADKKAIDEKARARALARFNAVWTMQSEPDPSKRSNAMEEIAKFSYDGEDTIIRTIADAEASGIAMTWNKDSGKLVFKDNWKKNPRAMLTARVITEGIRVVAPNVIVGIYSTEEELDMLEDKMRAPKTRAEIEETIDRLRREALDSKDGNARNMLLGQVADLQFTLEKMDETPAAQTSPLPDPEKPKTILPMAIEAEVTQETDPADLPGNGLPEVVANHVVVFVKIEGINGKKIAELTKDQVEIAKTRWCDKFPEPISKDPKRLEEAEKILAAFRFHSEKGGTSRGAE